MSHRLLLPFSETEFLDVFAAYNTALWPAVVAFWIVTLGFSIALMRGHAQSLALNAFVALHWAWEGVAYHAVFFSRINPAAWLFAGLFMIQAVAFVWFGIVLLVALPPVPRSLFVVPIVWSIIGGSAAFLLDMTADLMLFAAAAVLLIHAFDPAKLE